MDIKRQLPTSASNTFKNGDILRNIWELRKGTANVAIISVGKLASVLTLIECIQRTGFGAFLRSSSNYSLAMGTIIMSIIFVFHNMLL